MRLSIATRIILGTFILLVFGDDVRASEKENAVAFLKKSVIGRRLQHRSTDKMANNTMETEFSRESIFANLRETADGFTFDKLIVIKQTIWDLDGEQKRVGEGRKEDRQL